MWLSEGQGLAFDTVAAVAPGFLERLRWLAGLRSWRHLVEEHRLLFLPLQSRSAGGHELILHQKSRAEKALLNVEMASGQVLRPLPWA